MNGIEDCPGDHPLTKAPAHAIADDGSAWCTAVSHSVISQPASQDVSFPEPSRMPRLKAARSFSRCGGSSMRTANRACTLFGTVGLPPQIIPLVPAKR